MATIYGHTDKANIYINRIIHLFSMALPYKYSIIKQPATLPFSACLQMYLMLFEMLNDEGCEQLLNYVFVTNIKSNRQSRVLHL